MRVALLAMLVLAPAAAGQLLLRGPETPPGDAISSVSERGVFVVAPDGALHLVSWDRVLRIEGDQAEKAAEFMPVADAAWRARRRLERADAVGAEPLFEELFAQTRTWRGPTAAVIREGLMRCRLRRGAQIGAIEPWLALLEARASVEAGIQPFASEWARAAGLGEVLDPATGLAPALPPMWLDWASVRQFGAAGEPGQALENEQASALRALYVAAARFEAGLSAELPPATGDPAVRLVRDIVAARIGPPAERASARIRLRQRLDEGAAPWLSAWLRIALGRSLIREPDEQQRLLGVAELLSGPALFAETHPYLAGLGLAEASRELAQLGRIEASLALRRELEDRFPSHPALTIAWTPAPAAGQDQR
ncbi:MAG: hypothetical protein ACF8R7_16605 [Phycisphaerales bacterium JB039]